MQSFPTNGFIASKDWTRIEPIISVQNIAGNKMFRVVSSRDVYIARLTKKAERGTTSVYYVVEI